MDLAARLIRGDVVLLDGGVSTVMEQRGLAMDREIWSGTAHVTHPDLVRGVHEDYLRAGAEVITTNTFACAPPVLASRGIGTQEALEHNRAAVQLARAAREEVGGGDVWIAGSMSSMPPLTRITDLGTGPEVAEGYRLQAAALAEAGCDLILAEMMLDVANTALVLEAARATGLPVWVGFSASLDEAGNVTRYREPDEETPPGDFAEVVDRALAHGPQAAGVMHSELETTGPALEVVRARWPGPLLAYAETGAFLNPAWDFTGAAGPDAYADAAEGWVRDHGARVVGGCCGTGPEHIAALRRRLR